MDRIEILTVFLIAGVILSACERLETRKEKYPSGKLKAKWEVTVSRKGEFKNGIYEEYWENGKSKSFVNYMDNKEEGLYRAHHENGKVAVEIYFENGLMHGSSREWYDSGKKKRFAEYKNGQLHGTIKIWDPDGKLVARAEFDNGTCKKGDCKQISACAKLKLN